MAYYCGIDLGSRFSQICVIDDQVEVLFNRKVRNDLAKILAILEPYLDDLITVVESTFNWYWLVDGLQDARHKVVLAHSLGLAMISQAKVKTDRRDAFVLARLLRAGEIPEAYIYPRQSRPVRDLVRRREKLSQLRARQLTDLRQMLYREGLWDHKAKSVRSADEEILEIWFSDPEIRLAARQDLDRISLFTEQIKELEGRILEATQQNADYKRLLGIPGVGPVLAATIYYETGAIHRFKNARHYSSYCRVVPGITQSCEVRRRGRGSKQGNPHLKSAFTQASAHAIRYYPKIRRCRDRHLQRHRGFGGKMISNCIVAHKLAIATYQVLKRQVAFQEKLIFGN